MVLLLAGSGQAAFSQSGFFVPKAGKVFFTGDSSTIFSNVINQGNLGVGKNATLNFSGKSWQNDAQSLITDESNAGMGTTGEGGWIRFMADTMRQQLWGGYNAASKTGATFSKLRILNTNGVELLNGSTKVRREVIFGKGHVYLRDQIMVVGDGNPGTISGYDSSRFFVTGNSAGTGLLVRENLKRTNGLITFPVGSRENAYTPAALRNNLSTGDDYYVSVFDSIRSNVTSGRVMANESVNKTWEIGKRLRPNLDATDVLLQHLLSDEGSIFAGNRSNAFISQYYNNIWDTGYPQSTPGDGNLTTGSLLKGSGVNSRTFTRTISGSSYFTKLTGLGNDVRYKTKVILNAYRMDQKRVFVYWTTNPEINIKYFVVQRRLITESAYSNRDTVDSRALNGFSLNNIDYSMTDANSYTGISFYRLLLVGLNGDTSYSNIVAVGNHAGGIGALLWPNPTTGKFYVGLSAPGIVKTIAIYDAIGQLIRTEEVYNRGFIEMYLNIPGTYMVSFISRTGEIMETKKLIVGGY